MTQSNPPQGAYEKSGDYVKGDKVWVEDGGTWWSGRVEYAEGSSGQNLKVEITLPNGETRHESKSKDEVRMRP